MIERAFVPDTQVKRTNYHHDHLYEAELEKRAQVIGDKLRAGKEDGNSFKVDIKVETVNRDQLDIQSVPYNLFYLFS